MSKELEAFERIKNITYDRTDLYGIEVYRKSLDIIETALKKYEEMTNTPPIMCGRTHGYTQALIDTICKNYKEVKITNLEDEKKIKALEIIKEKGIILQFIKETYTVEQYNAGVFGTLVKPLTQEEYELLKEVFK